MLRHATRGTLTGNVSARPTFANASTYEHGPIRSSAHVAYDALKRDILTGRARPGAALHEGELAAALAVSKTPVREALGRLVREGYVDVRPRKGYRVTDLTLADVAELFAIRGMLEPAAAASAARHASPGQVEQLQDLAPVAYDIEDDDAFERSVAADRRFHLALADASGNGRLAVAMRSLLEAFERLYFMGPRLRRAAAAEATDHQALVEVLRQGDAEAARAVADLNARSDHGRVMTALLAAGLEPPAARSARDASDIPR
jgi:DNA-binding GntR family transcriptional regulator